MAIYDKFDHINALSNFYWYGHGQGRLWQISVTEIHLVTVFIYITSSTRLVAMIATQVCGVLEKYFTCIPLVVNLGISIHLLVVLYLYMVHGDCDSYNFCSWYLKPTQLGLPQYKWKNFHSLTIYAIWPLFVNLYILINFLRVY